MRRCLELMLLVIITTAVLTACGGDPSGPTEENLQARAEAFGAAIVDGNYSEIYEFGLPELKATCSKKEFLAGANTEIMAAATAMGLDEDAKTKTVIRASFGIDEDADVEVRSSEIDVSGNQGSVLLDLYLDDVHFGQLGDDSVWVFADGQWYLGGVIRSADC